MVVRLYVPIVPRWRPRPVRHRAAAYGRLPLRAPLIWCAVRVARQR